MGAVQQQLQNKQTSKFITCKPSLLFRSKIKFYEDVFGTMGALGQPIRGRNGIWRSFVWFESVQREIEINIYCVCVSLWHIEDRIMAKILSSKCSIRCSFVRRHQKKMFLETFRSHFSIDRRQYIWNCERKCYFLCLSHFGTRSRLFHIGVWRVLSGAHVRVVFVILKTILMVFLILCMGRGRNARENPRSGYG